MHLKISCLSTLHQMILKAVKIPLCNSFSSYIPHLRTNLNEPRTRSAFMDAQFYPDQSGEFPVGSGVLSAGDCDCRLLGCGARCIDCTSRSGIRSVYCRHPIRTTIDRKITESSGPKKYACHWPDWLSALFRTIYDSGQAGSFTGHPSDTWLY